MLSHLIAPHGGELINLLADADRCSELRDASRDWLSWDLTPRQLCDLELLLNGGFSPLRGFMSREDHEAVCASMRLCDGTLWPIPITLDVSEELARQIRPGDSITLRDPEGIVLAVLHLEEMWRPDKTAEAEAVHDTGDTEHPGVAHLLEHTHPWYVCGRLEGIQLPLHYDFCSLRLTPAQLRAEFSRLGWRRLIAFQTRNPMHRAHLELVRRAMREVGANILIHPAVGMTRIGDTDAYTRIRCYKAVLPYYPKGSIKLALLPLAMRMSGPREALWHAIIRKNYGCTHMIVGRDHAGPGVDSTGKPFYEPYAAQNLFSEYEEELGVGMVPFKKMVYVEDLATFLPQDEVHLGARTVDISGTELRRSFARGSEIPEWFSFPEVLQELERAYPPRYKQGLTIFLTGLSGAGKSTIANRLTVRLLEMGGRAVTLLDGDLIRKHLSSELGFSREHRDINVRRVGFVASEITRNGGIAICALIAPYESVRNEVRAMIESVGGFILVHVATVLEVCEQRDPKGMYAKARAGLIKEFTGITDPYQTPQDPAVVIDTLELSPGESVEKIIRHLRREGYIDANVEAPDESSTFIQLSTSALGSVDEQLAYPTT